MKQVFIYIRDKGTFTVPFYTQLFQLSDSTNICINEQKMCMSKSFKEKHNLLNHVISQNDEIHMKHSKVLKNHY
jgi:hypothetical protein